MGEAKQERGAKRKGDGQRKTRESQEQRGRLHDLWDCHVDRVAGDRAGGMMPRA